MIHFARLRQTLVPNITVIFIESVANLSVSSHRNIGFTDGKAIYTSQSECLDSHATFSATYCGGYIFISLLDISMRNA